MGKQIKFKVGEKAVLPTRWPGMVADEIVTIARWTKVCGPRDPERYIIKFADGGMLCAHVSSMQKVLA